MNQRVSSVLRRLVGRRSDRHLRRPDLAFGGAVGDGGSVALGLYVGAVSILLMAWSFVLALRASVPRGRRGARAITSLRIGGRESVDRRRPRP